MERSLGFVEDCRVVTRRVPDRQIVKRNVIVVMLERRGGRQNDVGVAGRFIECRINRDHEIDLLKRLVQCAPIGGRQYGVTRAREHQSNLTLARRPDLIDHRHRRQFIIELRQAPRSTGKTTKPPGVGVHYLIHSRSREQAAAGLIEVSGGDIDDLYRPLAQSAKRLGADPHAPITDPGICPSQLMCDAHRVGRANARQRFRPLGR